jgi:hypothetical protein
MEIPRDKGFLAFALIVDINRFMKMVSRSDADVIAQFTRDTLSGGYRGDRA